MLEPDAVVTTLPMVRVLVAVPGLSFIGEARLRNGEED